MLLGFGGSSGSASFQAQSVAYTASPTVCESLERHIRSRVAVYELSLPT